MDNIFNNMNQFFSKMQNFNFLTFFNNNYDNTQKEMLKFWDKFNIFNSAMKKVAESSNDYYQLLNWYFLKFKQIFSNDCHNKNYIAEIQKSNFEFASQLYKQFGKNIEEMTDATNNIIGNLVSTSKEFVNNFTNYHHCQEAYAEGKSCNNNFYETSFTEKCKDYKKK